MYGIAYLHILYHALILWDKIKYLSILLKSSYQNHILKWFQLPVIFPTSDVVHARYHIRMYGIPSVCMVSHVYVQHTMADIYNLCECLDAKEIFEGFND